MAEPGTQEFTTIPDSSVMSTVDAIEKTPEQKSALERQETSGILVDENKRLDGKLLTQIKMDSGAQFLVFNSRPTELADSTVHANKFFGFHPDLGPVAVDGYVSEGNADPALGLNKDSSLEERVAVFQRLFTENHGKIPDLLSRISTDDQFKDWEAAYKTSKAMAEKAIEENARKYTTQALEVIMASQKTDQIQQGSTLTEPTSQFGVANAAPEDAARMDRESAEQAALDAQNTLGHSQ